MKNYPLYQPFRAETIRELLDRAANEYGEKAFLEYEIKGQTRNVSYRKFKSEVDALCAWLRRTYSGKRHIAVLGENSHEWILVHFAIVCAGHVVVPLDKELDAQGIQELIHISECEAMFYSSTYRDIGQEIGQSGCTVYEMGRMEELIKEGTENSSDGYVPNGDDIASIVFTSGTTGQSKGVILSHRNFALDAYCAAQNIQLIGASLLLLPLHHTFGLVASVYFQMYHGNTVYINKSLKRTAEDIKKCRPTHLIVVPLIADQLCRNIWIKAKQQNKDKLLRMLMRVSGVLMKMGIDVRRKLFSSVLDGFGGRLEYIVSGGAPIERSTIDMMEAFGIRMINGYGITECAPIVSVNRNLFVVPGSVGVPLTCNEVKIAPDGEVLVRGDNVMRGYYKNEQATKEAFEGEWFKTGDLGKIDQYGALHIIGRKKNLIILSNGENIPAEPLESKILENPGVLEAIVYGKNNSIVAEVYLDPDAGVTLQSVRQGIQAMNKTLPQNQNIADIIERAEPFPKTTTKKIKR